MASHACGDALRIGAHLLGALVLIAAAGCGGGSSASGGAEVARTAISGTPLTQVQVGQSYSFTPSAADLDRLVSIANPSTTSYTIGNLSAGTWYFAIAADAIGGAQSALSNVVSTTLP